MKSEFFAFGAIFIVKIALKRTNWHPKNISVDCQMDLKILHYQLPGGGVLTYFHGYVCSMYMGGFGNETIRTWVGHFPPKSGNFGTWMGINYTFME